MKPAITLKHEFVEFIPGEIKPGTIYISTRFGTAAHLCCCGCGSKVVTPLRPTDWKLIFDGKTISLYPSVGNWSFSCKSHYWIRENKVVWAGPMSQKQIAAGRAHDSIAKDIYFENRKAPTQRAPITDAEVTKEGKPKKGFWQKFKKLFG